MNPVRNPEVNLFLLGKGGVGSAFARLASGFLPNINFRLIGIADSTRSIIDKDSSLEDYKKLIADRDLSRHSKCLPNAGLADLSNRLLALNLPNLIVIDATAEETGLFWNNLMAGGIAVVTANKKPLAGGYSDFAHFQEKPALFRYESTVGGGLPIISTLTRLRNSGDEIIDIRGLLSGTLSYIMNEVSSGKPFSEAVREAHSLGYTEPDPRDDLSGIDLKRKALILARTIGAAVEPEAVLAQSLVPDELQTVPVKDFLEQLRAADHIYRRTERMGYVVTVTTEGARLGVEALAQGDPLSTLSGPENMVAIRTKRYFKHPLVIRGPGAGAEVTAAGMMGDVLRVLGVL